MDTNDDSSSHDSSVSELKKYSPLPGIRIVGSQVYASILTYENNTAKKCIISGFFLMS